MNIDDITLGQLKEIQTLNSEPGGNSSLNEMVGKKVIIRTYSAGVWFGKLKAKSGNG